MTPDLELGNKLSAYGLRQMYYLFSVSKDKFDIDRFIQATKGMSKGAVVEMKVGAEDAKSGDYRAEFFGEVEEKDIFLRLDYFPGPGKRQNREQPYAENLMEWIGTFFKHENAHTHIHARFSYLNKLRESKFRLPLKIEMRKGVEDSISGVSFDLGGEPEGISTARLLLGEENLSVEVIANRRITFKGFTPYTEVQAFTSILDLYVGEKEK